ncbi:MAG: arylsulfatase [Verrucomicrobiales bacterium]|nr:arylsulfatase [Verrucomicrobiales bacterium]
MIRNLLFLVGLLILPGFAADTFADETRPNVLLIMVDDLGYSDLGSYGSEIETPNIDRLAAQGLRFSQFYNTAKCHSSRIAMLTGRYAFQAGDTTLKHATTTAETLGAAGYHTMMSGKWHLDREPTDFGFARYFGHLSGACNYYRGDKTFRLNGEPWEVPGEGFYTTVAMVDHALAFLSEARSEKADHPWYLHVAFNAPHAPLQPLEADYKKYLGRYDAGWDAVREARVRKQQQLGLFREGTEASPRPSHIPAWDKMEPERQDWEARRMTALAGMIDRVDQEIGRLLADLEANGELENTLLMFVSDNGACPYDRTSRNMDAEPYLPDTSWSDSTGWSWARNSPFRYYKQNQHEGGVATPAIIHWPAGLKSEPGSITREPAHLVDILPTIAEIGKATVASEWPDRELRPIAGESFLPLLKNETWNREEPIYFIFGDDRGLREGPWKLVSFRSNPWELYKIDEDRTELNNLAADHPEILNRMVAEWHRLAETQDHAPAKARKPVMEAATEKSMKHPEWTAFDQKLGPSGKRVTGKPKQSQRRPGVIRARKDTRLRVEGNELIITCEGEDSGLAFDQLTKLQKSGPYRLRFRIQSSASGSGDLFWTTDAKTKLPAGERIPFEVHNDGTWQDIELAIDSSKTLFGFRLDPAGGPGEVRIANLELTDEAGKVLISWPEKTK